MKPRYRKSAVGAGTVKTLAATLLIRRRSFHRCRDEETVRPNEPPVIADAWISVQKGPRNVIHVYPESAVSSHEP